MKEEEFMKVNGKETRGMEMDMKFSKMGIAIEDSILTTNRTEKEFINGIMEKFMMESGFKDKKTVSEFGKDYIMIVIRENGKTIKLKGLELIFGVMGIGMKENGLPL